MAQLAPMMQLRPRFEDKCGHPLAGGNVFAFEAGTSNPKATYADAEGTIPNTHPIKLDYRGEADIFLLSGRYRFVVYSCTGGKIYDVDDVGEWLGTLTADRVIDGDKTQHQINSEQALTNTELSESIANEKERAELAEAALDTTINNESIRAVAAEQALDTKIAQEVARALSVEGGLQTQINNLGGGVFGFMTYAAFDAVKATIAANSVVVIGEPNNTGTGSWGQGDNIWNGTVLTKSPYDPYTLAVATALVNSKNEALKATSFFMQTSSTNLFELTDLNLYILALLNRNGEMKAQDFYTDYGSLNALAKSVWTIDIPGVAIAFIDKGGNILSQIKTDGTVVDTIQPATYGVTEMRNGVASIQTANDLGLAYDKALTANDTALKYTMTVSPFQADETRHQRMASAIKVGPNRLYVAFSQFSTMSTDQSDGRLVGRFVEYDLVNQTSTVSETQVIIGEKFGNVYRHPHFIQLRDRILLIFNGAINELFVYESFDKCQTWVPKTTIDCTPPLPWATALDSAVLIEEGRYKGRIVLSLFRYSATDGLVGTVYSDDGGATWKRGQTLHGASLFPTYPSINETTVALDSQQNLIFIIRNEEATTESRYLIFAKSTDGGETLQIFEQTQRTPAIACQTGIKQTAPIIFDGLPRMIATCPTTGGGNRESFRLRISYDNCMSWAKTYKPFVDTLRVGYSSVVPLDSKTFALVYEEGTMNASQSIKITFFNLKEVS